MRRVIGEAADIGADGSCRSAYTRKTFVSPIGRPLTEATATEATGFGRARGPDRSAITIGATPCPSIRSFQRQIIFDPNKSRARCACDDQEAVARAKFTPRPPRSERARGGHRNANPNAADRRFPAYYGRPWGYVWGSGHAAMVSLAISTARRGRDNRLYGSPALNGEFGCRCGQ
jgi:hypothetical protein